MKRLLFILSFFHSFILSFFSPYKNLPIRILKRGGKWIALVKMEGQEMVVSKFFAQMKGESLTCLYVDVTGTTANGNTVTKRINNK